MTTSAQDRLEARLARHIVILDNLYATMEEAASTPFQRLELDTNEGRQETQEKRIDRIQDAITKEEAVVDSINTKLNRTGLVSLNNRRR